MHVWVTCKYWEPLSPDMIKHYHLIDEITKI